MWPRNTGGTDCELRLCTTKAASYKLAQPLRNRARRDDLYQCDLMRTS